MRFFVFLQPSEARRGVGTTSFRECFACVDCSVDGSVANKATLSETCATYVTQINGRCFRGLRVVAVQIVFIRFRKGLFLPLAACRFDTLAFSF